MKPALVFAGTASTERRGRCGPGGLFDSELYLMDSWPLPSGLVVARATVAATSQKVLAI